MSTAYSYDLNDRLTSQGGTTYSYDENGNTLTETLDSTVKTYSYDAKNKLIGVSTTESDVEVSSSAYSYNVNGIRDSKTEGGVTTSYVVDSNRDYAQVLEEVVDGLSTVTYSYGHDLLSQSRNDDFKFYLYDGLGSTRGLSNSAGVVTDSYDYEAFGVVLSETGTTENNYKFTGEQFDSSLDQYYLRARYYDQGIGRFTQQDTYMGNNHDPVSLHKYMYANADPVTYTDPTGNFSLGSLSAGMSIGVRLATTSIGTRYTKLAIGKAIKYSAAFAIGANVKLEVKRCLKSKGDRCRIPNLVVIGSNHPESQKHIGDAQVGKGSNGVPISPLVTYKKGANKSRGWISRSSECEGKNKAGSGKQCDEYPYAASVEGGKKRYMSGRVSLRPISASDNQGSGGVYGRAVRRGKSGDKYLIVPYGPTSFYYSNGKFGF